MSDELDLAPPIADMSDRRPQMYPTLTPAQIARIRPFAHDRDLADGEVVIEQGQTDVPLLVVLTGAIDIIHPATTGTRPTAEQLITSHVPGSFTGEVNLIAGRRSLVTARAHGATHVLEVPRARMLTLVQSDAELGELMLRAFILRRMGLIAQHHSDVVLIGSRHSSGTLRVQEFLTRNGHPYTYVDADQDPNIAAMLDGFHVGVGDIPVLVCRGDKVLKNPSNREVADCLGLNQVIDATQVRQVVVVGGGPAGLAAAVYAASEGLDVTILEASSPGGQAGSSSKIENYLGFPTGISGGALAARALTQAEKFGAEIVVATSAVKLHCDKRPYELELSGGGMIAANTIVIATGAEYRRPELADFGRYEGLGVYYGATHIEAQLCGGDDVAIVGGGNSAGQAAVFLAQTVNHVHILVRGAGLAETMSRYLIRRIEDTPNITLHTHTEIEGVSGDEHLEQVTWRDKTSNKASTHRIRHVFMMIGAMPNTEWLAGCIATDRAGFIQTGTELTTEMLATRSWPLTRPPMLLETSLPGVFAVGDVRASSIKRVASGVGEGSACIALVHRALAE